jgi:hypothetical protein
MSFNINSNSENYQVYSPSINYSSQNFYVFFDFLLDEIIRNKLGPTLTTRFLYISGVILHSTYLFTNSVSSNIFKEFSNFRINLKQPDYIYNYIVYKGLKKFYEHISFNSTNLDILYNNLIQSLNDLDKGYLETFSNSGIFLNDKLYPFLDSRNNDGWKNANNPVNYPNSDKYIDYNNSQSLNTYLNDTSSWTPLLINGKVQKYLTPYWGQVQDVLNNNEIRNKYRDIAEKNYPINNSRNLEIDNLVDIYNNSFDDTKKMIAEFFEGGPGTVSPPGIWNIFGYYATKSLNLSLENVSTFFYILNSTLFQSSIVCWEIKLNYLQSRPIQAIRINYFNELITSYDGDNILGNMWKPYQATNFVTPPFPDYISGHSTFSSSASVIFEKLLKQQPVYLINLENFSTKHLNYISPIFTNSNNVSNISTIFIDRYSSKILNNIPNCILKLSFNSWNEIANYSGISRIYGGIHNESSNTTGLLIGKMIANDILNSRNL